MSFQNILKNKWLLLSGAVGICLFGISLSVTMVALGICALVALIICCARGSFDNKQRKMNIIVIMLSFLSDCFLVTHFILVWLSSNQLATLADLLHLPAKIFLLILALTGGILAFYSINYAFSLFITVIDLQFNFKSITYVFSGAILMLLVVPLNHKYLSAFVVTILLFLLLGTIVGAFAGTFATKTKFSNPVKISGIFITVIFMIPLCSYFVSNCETSSVCKSLEKGINFNVNITFIVIAIILAIVSFPTLYFLIKLLIKWLINFCGVIRKECSLKYLSCNGKRFFLTLIMVVLNLLLAIVLGVALLVAAYSLPLTNIEKNVQKSADIMQEEGNYPQMYLWCSSKLDNYTDSLMLIMAADDTDASTIEKAVMAYRGKISNDPCNDIKKHYVYGVEYTQTVEYSRYWHGYQIILKPLLELMDYQGIRVLNFITQIVLLVIIGLLMFRRKKGYYFLAYILAYVLLMPDVLGNSLQFSSCYYAFSLSCIGLLLLPDKMRHKYAFLVFLNLGIFTAYFDLLTYPMATFGIPALIYMVLEGETSVGKTIGDIFKSGIAWCVGFGGMWSGKCVVTYITTGFNSFSDSSSAFLGWVSKTGIYGEIASLFGVEFENYVTLITTPAILIYAIIVFCLIWKIYKKRTVSKITGARVALPYFLIALSPVVWHAFASKHSSIHYWFTNKSCVITLLALLFCLISICVRDENEKGRSGLNQFMELCKIENKKVK